jgi:predicted homoserine dehydrogenase-like protein
MKVRMLVEFVAGSKTTVKMAAIANATGLVPDVTGMHGPAATLDQLSKVLGPKKDGGVLSKVGVVDHAIGKGGAPGVFVAADMSHPRISERMEDLKMGKGPYFTPHLTCARGGLDGKADIAPLPRPVAGVAAVAKRDMKPGDPMDQIGEC